MEEMSMEGKIDIIVQTIDSYGKIYLSFSNKEDELCNLLRSTFNSQEQLEDYELTDDKNRRFKFSEYIKDAIFQTVSPAHKKVVEEWKKFEQYKRDRTGEEDEILRKKKSIFDNIQRHYKNILLKTFGPTCLRCEKKDKRAYTYNCNCRRSGVCNDCLQMGCFLDLETYTYRYVCYSCEYPIKIFKDLYKNDHSLKSLFSYAESPLDENDNDLFLVNRPSRKRRHQDDDLIPNEDAAPVPDEEIRDQVANEDAAPGPDEEIQDQVPDENPVNENHNPLKDLNYYKLQYHKYKKETIRYKKIIVTLRSKISRLQHKD